MSRLACVTIVSLSMLLPSLAFRVKPKRRGHDSSTPTATSNGDGKAPEDQFRDKAAAKLDGTALVSTLETSLQRKGNPEPTPAPPPPPVSGSGFVVTLGDSYSSGTGIHRSGDQYEGGDCWREVTTTPGARFAAAENQPFVNNACKGGVVPDIHHQFDEIKQWYPAAAAKGFADSTILFTIGGNDLRTFKGETWPGLLTSCIMSFYGACHEKDENQIANWDELQAIVTEFYIKLAQDAPNAKIRVLGYPRLMQRKVFCMAVPGLHFGAADWADRQVDELNRRLRLATDDVRSRFAPTALAQEASDGNMLEDQLRQKATANMNRTAIVSSLETSLQRKGDPAPAPTPPPAPSSVDIQFVDVQSYYSKGACRVFNKDVNSIVLDGFSLSDSSFHPSQRGYNKYYDSLAHSVGRVSELSVALEDLPDHESFMHILQGWDTNKDGKLDIGEVLAMAAPGAGPGEGASSDVEEQARSFFRECDRDKDNHLNLAEFEEFTAFVENAEEAA